MTVSTLTRKAYFPLDQIQDEFDFTFRALTASPEDIKCIATTNGTDTILTYTTDYSVAVASDGVGGTVTLVDPTAVSKGTLTVYRETTNKQESDYDDYNQFPADTLENDLDRRTLIDQEQDEAIVRTARLPVTSSVDAVLPLPEAGKYIGWNGTADGLANLSSSVAGVFYDGRSVGLGTAHPNLQGFASPIPVITIGTDDGGPGQYDDTSVLELASAYNSTDGDNREVNEVDWVAPDYPNPYKKIVAFEVYRSGTTAGNRGGFLDINTKQDNGILALAVRFDNLQKSIFYGQVQVPPGATATPGLAFSGYPTTGLYLADSPETLNFTVLNNQVIKLESAAINLYKAVSFSSNAVVTGNLSVGTNDGGYQFVVNQGTGGQTTAESIVSPATGGLDRRLNLGTRNYGGGIISAFIDVSNQGETLAKPLYLNPGGGVIYTGAGSFGIGKTDPATALDVNGTVTATLFSGSAASLTNFPTLNQNTSGTAANLSGTPTVPNGTAATTQSQADNTTKLATTAYVDTGLGTKLTTPGAWTTPAFDAGDFTASGSMTWTVAAGDVTTYAYSVVGKTMNLTFRLATTTVGGTPAYMLYLKIPGGYTAAKTTYHSFVLYDGTNWVSSGCDTVATGTTVRLYHDPAGNTTWPAGTDTTYVFGTITFEVQ